MLGGVARLDQLRRVGLGPAAVSRAVSEGRVERLAPGRFGLASAQEAHRAAMRLGGSVGCLSAALEHRWPVLVEPDRPWVAVPNKRHLSAARRRGVHVLWNDDATGGVTSPLVTVLDCLRRLTATQALAVADSALRSGVVDPDELCLAAMRLRGPGSTAAQRLAPAASPLAQNPLESAARAIALDVPGLDLVPQVPIRLSTLGVTVHPDLVDERLGIVVETEGWLYHGMPEQFALDLERYTALVVEGHLVLRFGHEHVVRRPVWVRDCLESIARTGSARLEAPRRR